MRWHLRASWWLAVGVLVGIGFIQLFIFPDLQAIPGVSAEGWDPHSGRMVSTWLDPNFFGGFIGLALLFIGLYSLDVSKQKQLGLFLALCVLGAALAFTESRSSWVALFISVSVGLPLLIIGLMSRADKKVRGAQIAIGGLMVVGLSGILVVLLRERFTQLFFADPTVALRVESLRATWATLAVKNTLFGEGYNAYQFAALREGLISSFTAHSRAGSDSSLLTLWVTTGIWGVLLFLMPLAAVVLQSIRVFLSSHKVMYLFPVFGILFLLVHSAFVNSLLYGHILLTVGFLFALVFVKLDEVAV